MNEQDIWRIVNLARVAAEAIELGLGIAGRVKALLAAEGQDDEALQAAIGRLDAAIARAKAEAGQ